MRKIKCFDLVLCIGCIWVIATLFNVDSYNENGRGLTDSILFYLAFYKVDEYLGRTGIIIFFIALALIFLFDFLRNNIASIKNRYREWE